MNYNNFSLILGGGAARGLAHIGVIRYLEEHQITPSLIVGTSMGALVGAFYACGYTSHKMEKIALSASLLQLLDIDIKKGGIKGEKIIKYLEEYLGNKEFSDLQIPLKIIATNIDTGEKVVFSQGRVVDAIRASISIPGIFTPFLYEGAHLIDGGVVANLPIEEALPGLPVIALSVQMRGMFHDEEKVSELFGMNFFTQGYYTLRRTIQLMMIKNEQYSYATNHDTLFLHLSCDDVEYYDFSQVGILIEEGQKVASPIADYLKDFEGNARPRNPIHTSH